MCDSEICAPSPNGGTEGWSRVNLHWPPWSSPKWSQIHVLSSHWWRMLGLRVWSGNKANVLPVEHIIISLAKESAAGEVQYQDHVVFFDIDGLVHHEFIPTGQTVNKEFYKTAATPPRCCAQTSPWEVALRQLDPAPRQHPCPQGCHHKLISGKHNISSLTQPPYSPELAPCDFLLFPQLKKTMKGRRFDYVEDIQANATRQLRAITKSDYQRCFRQWQERWNKCIQA